MDIKEIFANLQESFNPDAAIGVDAVYQFEITGEGGGQWNATIKDGRCTVKEGTVDSPNCTVVTDAETWLSIVSKKTSATDAFMSGNLRIKGDMDLAMKLETMFLA